MKKLLATLLALCLFVLPLCVSSAEANDVYVLMNIPFADFYAAEVDDASVIDAVTSSTLMKPRAGTLAGGSYHVDPEGSDITGVVFPVRVSAADLNKLAGLGGVEITDESAVEITVTLRGNENTTTYEGADALFEAPSYSWYVLTETPTQYKSLEIKGAPSFGAIEGAETQTVEAAASFICDKHADYVIRVTGMDDVLADQQVSGIVLEAGDTKVGLRHIANIWRGTEIGFKRDSAIYEALAGKRIDRITFITRNAEYAVDTDLFVTEDEMLPKLTGSYIELFPEFAKAEFKDWWMECIKAYVNDDEAAEGYYTALTQNYMGALRGQAAIDAYGDNPESMVFNCGFTDGLAKLTISGNVISGVDANGDELFRHSYSYLEDLPVSFFGQDMGIGLRVYQSDDADSGVFTYFAFTDDNLKDTQHIEFRYGATLENLANYSEGEYAYWLASGTQDGYKESLLKDCIKLFVDENVGGQGEQEAAEGLLPEETSADPNGVFPAIAGESGTTYVSLFDVIISDRWTPVWQDYITAVVGEDAAAETTARLQGSITSDLYGEEAVAAFADGGYAFDCDFINGAQSITFNNDNTVTILKMDGESETHTYEYLGQTNVGETETMMYQGAEISMAFPVDVYKSTDEAGEFNYFLLREDTMAETYHIEFRYGSDLKALQGYMVGPYAYWLAAGIDESADEATIDKVIALFCLENMDYSAHSDAALAQIDALGLVGEWVADLAPLGEAYASVDLRMSIDATGHGITLMNGQQTADFEAYAYDSGEKDDGEGIYVAYSNTENEAEAAPYALTVACGAASGEAGETVLTLTADDGTISWVKQDGETASKSPLLMN